MTRRVVVTGMGVISPLGEDVETTWTNMKAGVSGIGAITRFDTEKYSVKIAAEVKNWDATKYMNAKEARRRDLNEQFSVAAATQAIEQAGLVIDESNRQRVGVFVGSAVGGISSYYSEVMMIFETGDPRRITPFGIPMLVVNGSSGLISIMTGAMGPSYTPISACATGADCIGHAFDMVRLGRLDCAIAGAGEAPIIPVGIAVFDRMGALSRENDTPERAIRPFDKYRPGLVFGEGSGVIVLEALEMAQARGATILGEIVGYGSSSDAFHITAPEPEGLGASMAITTALRDAGVAPEDIHYVNAHGTGTALNDAMETKAIKRALGEHAYNVPMSSTKSMTGHAMGATAASEAIFTMLALRDQVAPPTINLEEADPECDLDYVPNQARAVSMEYAVSNAFGFGGHNVALVFKRYHD